MGLKGFSFMTVVKLLVGGAFVGLYKMFCEDIASF